jgi:hypothetical protein
MPVGLQVFIPYIYKQIMTYIYKQMVLDEE